MDYLLNSCETSILKNPIDDMIQYLKFALKYCPSHLKKIVGE